MWMVFAALSALFAGITAILSKMGVKNTDSTLATALRTVVVLVFAWAMVFIRNLQPLLVGISAETYGVLFASGLCTGASWLCYFRALKLGPVPQVTAVDKTSTVLTMALAFLLLGEPIGPVQALAMVLILCGTLLMIDLSPRWEESQERPQPKGWLLPAALAAVFAALTAILGKVGMQGIPSDLGTAIRTTVVLVMAWMMVFLQGKQKELGKIPGREGVMIALSGVATGASWLCYYRALQDGLVSVVVPIDKLSLVVTVAFSRVFLGERLTGKALYGFLLVVGGTLLLVL